MAQDWKDMEDTFAGERQIKDCGREYLPPTPGQIEDKVEVTDSKGWKSYQAYKQRAIFPSHVYDTVTNMLGLMHSKPAEIKVPAALKSMVARATSEGESLQQLLERINEQQLKKGRLGLLLDLPSAPTATPQPYIVMYDAERIINWDEGAVDDPNPKNLNLVVLNESELGREEFVWKTLEKYRVLQLGVLQSNEARGVYSQAVYAQNSGTGLEYRAELQTAPTIRGKTLDEIPFVFCNTRDILPRPDKPPLLSVAEISLAIYRGEADYRLSLFMQGQDTLVVIGGNEDDEIRVGANARVDVPLGGDAKYIGVGHEGLIEQRNALDGLNRKATVKGGEMLDSSSSEKESGDALRIRVGARAATLTQVAMTGAAALAEILRMAARWMGASEDEVQVKPNLDFITEPLAGQDLAQIMTAKQLGAKISDKSIHELMRRRKMTTMTYEEELAEIEAEPPPLGLTPGVDQNGPGPNNLPGGGPGNSGT
jgi:hypothetical protein